MKFQRECRVRTFGIPRGEDQQGNTTQISLIDPRLTKTHGHTLIEELGHPN